MLKAIVQCCFKEYEKNFTKFIGKRFWWCGFNYSYRPRPAAFLKTELYYRCFPVKKNSTTAFLQNISWWLLLTITGNLVTLQSLYSNP